MGEFEPNREVARIIFHDTLRTGGDEVIEQASQALKEDGGAEIVASVLGKYLGCDGQRIDGRVLAIGDTATINICAANVMSGLITEIDQYLAMEAEQRTSYREAL